MVYKALVRSHVEYANVVWSSYQECDIYVLEGVQRRATTLINSIQHLTYGDWKIKITYSKIPQSKRWYDQSFFKILHGYYDSINKISQG